MDDIENQAIVVLPREVLRLGPRANRKKKINVEETVEKKGRRRLNEEITRTTVTLISEHEVDEGLMTM